jgi:hypothetical protein
MGELDKPEKKKHWGRGVPKVTNDQVKAAIIKTRGLVYLAAQALNITPQALFMRARKFPEIRQLIENERNRIIDFGEAKLVEAVGKGEGWAVCFLLKTQGRRRGYSERFEVEDLRREVEALRNDVAAAIGGGAGTPLKIEIADNIGYPELPC